MNPLSTDSIIRRAWYRAAFQLDDVAAQTNAPTLDRDCFPRVALNFGGDGRFAVGVDSALVARVWASDLPSEL
jgi:hypothetical protein